MSNITWTLEFIDPCPAAGRPALVAFAGKVFAIFEAPSGGQLRFMTRGVGDYKWSSPQDIPASGGFAHVSSGVPGVAVFSVDGVPTLFCVHEGAGDDGKLMVFTTTDGVNWSRPGSVFWIPFSHSNGTTGSPELVVFQNQLYLFHEGQGDSGWISMSRTSDGKIWSNDVLIPNSDNAFGCSGAPTAVEFAGKLYLIRQGRKNSGWMWCASFDGTSWSADALLPNDDNAFGLSDRPAAVVFNDRLQLFHAGRDDVGSMWHTSFDGSNWDPDANLTFTIPNGGGQGATRAVDGISAAVLNGTLHGMFLGAIGNSQLGYFQGSLG